MLIYLQNMHVEVHITLLKPCLHHDLCIFDESRSHKGYIKRFLPMSKSEWEFFSVLDVFQGLWHTVQLLLGYHTSVFDQSSLSRQLHFCTVFGRWTLPTSGEPPERRQSRQFFGPAPAAQTPEEEQLRCQNPAQGRPKIFSYLDFMPSGELVLLLIISKNNSAVAKNLGKIVGGSGF